MAAVEGKSVTPAMIVQHLDDFIRANRHSNDLETRWLANYLQLAAGVAGQVRNGALHPDYIKKVAEFRADELDNQIQDKKNEMRRLETEREKLKVA